MKPLFRINPDVLYQAGLRPVFEALTRSTAATGIDFFLIGALARDTWFSKNRIASRRTADIDFAVFVASSEEYLCLKNELIRTEKFSETNHNQFVLISPDGIQLDLLPFGAIEEEGKVLIKGIGLSSIEVDGFGAVYEFGTELVQFDDHLVFKVSSLAGIVLLKLIAYDDRPEVRQKDIADVTQIINNYFEIESDLIYEHHNDLFDEKHTNLLHLAARVLGRQINRIVYNSPDLKTRVTGILYNAINDPNKKQFLKLMIRGTENTLEDAAAILTEIINGINDDYTVN